MKLFKKIVLLGLAMLTCLSLGIVSACDNNSNASSSSSSSDVETDFIYRIKVQNATGYGFSNARVSLMDGDEVVASTKTSSSGYATFVEGDLDGVDEYTIQVTDLPTGYEFSDTEKTYKTGAWEGFESAIQIEPSGVIKQNAPIGTGYTLGEVMYDFTVTTSEGKKFTLSEMLEEKDLVVLNFWATWCTPCKQEFPAMQNAYVLREDNVAILAISTTDNMDAVREFKAQNGLTFDMTSNSECGANIAGMFDTAYIPLTVMIDRYGAITYHHTGNMTAASDFTSRFDRFIGESYQPTIIVGAGDSGSGGGDEETDSNLILPNVPAPSLKDVNNVLANGSDTFTFSWYENENDPSAAYSWPWLISDSGYLYSPIATNSLHGNFSTLTATFKAAPGDTVYFDYMIHTEDADILYVLVDGVPVQQLSGINNAKKWTKNFSAYVFKEGYDTEGEHEISFLFQKDSSGSVDAEAVYIKNLRIEHNADNANSNVFRYAANNLDQDIWTCNVCQEQYVESDLITVTEGEGETAVTTELCCPNCYNEGKDGESVVSVCNKTYTAQKKKLYKYYAEVVLNEEDGYYHVGTEDGPLLFANLMLSSQWSAQSLWNLAYSGYIVINGYNFSEEIENFAWGANQPIPGKALTYGYTPVTEELKELLIFATKSTVVAEDGYKYWLGDWYEEQWLELCVYYENYGENWTCPECDKRYKEDELVTVTQGKDKIEHCCPTCQVVCEEPVKPIDDPMKTITFHAAEKVTIGTLDRPVANTANILFQITPRGFKYKIVPEESGVYHIYSVGNSNTVCFFFGTSTTSYVYYDDVLGATHANGEADENFNFHVYLEAGKTYYLSLTTYLDVVGKYDFYVTHVGSQYAYMEHCATGPYSYNEVTGEEFLPDAIDYYYDEVNDVYRTLRGEIIYVDMNRPTMFFESNNLYDTAREALRVDENGDPIYKKENRAFYVRETDTDYSELIREYGRKALLNSGDYEGFVALNKELHDALVAITTSAKYGGIDESWQLLSYYYTTLEAR